MSDLVRTTVYLTKRNKFLYDKLAVLVGKTKVDLLNEGLTPYLENLVKSEGLEKIVNDLEEREKKD